MSALGIFGASSDSLSGHSMPSVTKKLQFSEVMLLECFETLKIDYKLLKYNIAKKIFEFGQTV